MGYRSDVGIVIACTENSYPAFKLGLELVDKEVAEFINTFEITEKEDMVFLTYSNQGVKWYTQHEIPLIKYISSLEDKDPTLYNKIRFGFVRVGEETHDIETEYINRGYAYIYPSTGIIFDN